MKLNLGYLSQPTIHEDKISFICDDDLWTIDRSRQETPFQAQRMTANLGTVSHPIYSPDGKFIAFCGTESGQRDLYLIPARGGEFRRITYLGIFGILCWKDNRRIMINSCHESFHRAVPFAYTVDIETGLIEKYPYGPVHALSFSQKGTALLGRNCKDSARWKRYRGGTAGVFWLENGRGKFERILQNIRHNLTNPIWIGDHLYFVSDHEGLAQVYRCSATGKNVKRLTHSLDYYVRGLESDGKNLIYHCGGDLYISDLAGKSTKLDIEVPTPGIQAQTRFESPSDYLDDVILNEKGNEIAAVARGHLFRMKPWSQGTMELPADESVRNKFPVYLDENRLLVVRSNHVEDETLHILDLKTNQLSPFSKNQNWGKIWSLSKNPKQDQVILTNNHNEIYTLDLKKRQTKKIEASSLGRFSGISFSPDGRYVVYTAYYTQERTGLRIYDNKNKSVRWMIEPVLSDWSGSFDATGKYFYFLSVREFCPNYNWTHFDLGFPFAGRPFVITLGKDTVDPFHAHLDGEGKNGKDKKEKKNKKKTPEKKDVVIDWENLEQRIQGIPVKLGGYISLVGLENKVLYYRSKIQPIRNFDDRPDEAPDLFVYQFEKGKEELFQSNVRLFDVSGDHDHILMRIKNRLRLVSTRDLPREGNAYDKGDGWVDLSRIRLKVDPRAEWRQMYREAWELQREHFWDEALTKVDWNLVYRRYRPLLDRVLTRSEMSDLLWEMQGELGTSHCYEFHGDFFRRPPSHPIGYLGGDFKFNSKLKAFEVVHLFHGDAWSEDMTSPLLGPKAGLRPGDLIFAIDGIPLDSAFALGKQLWNKGGANINLLIQRKGQKNKEVISVTALHEQMSVQYRRWVEGCKKRVHERSKGQLGYVHIPDMGAYGYAEFHRHYLAEFHHQGLVVDVRYNGGGNVSQHILKTLAQRVLGFDQTRWNGFMTYPSYAVNGPLVAITNEQAGSDGDIFSHTFKLMKLGPLLGKRTWGGVIGINGQYQLRDGTVTTQPEYSFWFKDVGWTVENYGVDPDIEVDLTPMDWARGNDVQLDRAVDVALGLLKKNPPLRPKLDLRPNLQLPKRLP